MNEWSQQPTESKRKKASEIFWLFAYFNLHFTWVGRNILFACKRKHSMSIFCDRTWFTCFQIILLHLAHQGGIFEVHYMARYLIPINIKSCMSRTWFMCFQRISLKLILLRLAHSKSGTFLRSLYGRNSGPANTVFYIYCLV